MDRSAPQPAQYDRIAKWLHWAIAFLIIGQFLGGWLMVHLTLPTGAAYNSYQLHKSFGFLVLGLSVFRLGWRLVHRPPALPTQMKRWERGVAVATHWAFYGLMLGVPLAGWALVSVDPYQIPTKLFFVLPIPHLPLPVSEGLAGLFSNVHGVMAKLTMLLFLLHMGAALKHHFKDRDEVLSRMIPDQTSAVGRKSTRAGAAVILVALISFPILVMTKGGDATPSDPKAGATASDSATETDAPHAWAIQDAGTFLELTGSAFGMERRVRINDVQGAIVLDPLNPASHGNIAVVINLASLDGGGTDITERLTGANWFDVGTHPMATYRADAIVGSVEDGFVAQGTLTLKGISQRVDLPFILSVSGNDAQAAGKVTIDRTAFGLGDGGSGVAPQVAVTVNVTATRILSP